MEEDHDFTEFEGIELQQRRALLPWWIWLFMAVFTVLSLGFLVAALIDGDVLTFSIFGLNRVLPYPYSGVISFLVLALFAFTAVNLWLEKRHAIFLGRLTMCIGLGICFSALVLGLIHGHFSMRVEMVPLVDLLFRLTEIRKDWKYKAVSRYEIE